MCLFLIFAALAPRLALVLLWIFTPLVDRAFAGILLPVLGLIFLPFTTLFYVLAFTPGVGLVAWGWLLVVVGLLIDLGAYGRGARSRRR